MQDFVYVIYNRFRALQRLTSQSIFTCGLTPSQKENISTSTQHWGRYGYAQYPLLKKLTLQYRTTRRMYLAVGKDGNLKLGVYTLREQPGPVLMPSTSHRFSCPCAEARMGPSVAFSCLPQAGCIYKYRRDPLPTATVPISETQ